MATISASQLRTYSIEALMEDHLMANNHAVISVKNEPKFVIVTIERYNELINSRIRDLKQTQKEDASEDESEVPGDTKFTVETKPSLITKIRNKFF